MTLIVVLLILSARLPQLRVYPRYPSFALRRKVGDIIVIGDRSSDLAAAKAVNGAFVGCVYGYGSQGELDGADELVKNPFEIAPAVKRLTDR